MKKLFVILLGIFILTGCTKGETVMCTINNKEAIFEMKDGMITSYKLDEKNKSSSEVDEINGTYFTSSTNNEEGKEALKKYVSSLGGSCNF